MSILAMCKSTTNIGNRPFANEGMVSVGDEYKMPRITTSGILTSMMQIHLPTRDGIDKPSIGQSVTENGGTGNPSYTDLTIPCVFGTSPNPAISQGVNIIHDGLGKEPINLCGSQTDGFKRVRSHDIIPFVTRIKYVISQHIGSVNKCCVYYSDNRLDPIIERACQRQLLKSGLPIVNVSLQPLDFGFNIVLWAKRGILTMFQQILVGIEALEADIIYLSEYDVIYHPSHFDFVPPDPSKIWFNLNVWDVRASDGHALYHEGKRTSQICAYRDVLLEHYRKRVEIVERDGFSRRMGFEPGTHGRAERVDDLQSDTWMSEYPNLDIKHGKNLTKSRWKKEEFRNQRYTKGWAEADSVDGWGVTKDRFMELLEGV